MSETKETALCRMRQPAATLGYGGRITAARYADPAAEAAALRDSVGLVDAGMYEWLAVHGDDARDFLQRMLSQEIAAMSAESVVHACLLDRKGQLIAPMRVWHLRTATVGSAERFLLELPGSTVASVAEVLERYIIADDVELSDESESYTALAVLGPRSQELLASLGLEEPLTPGGVRPWPRGEAVADWRLGELRGAIARLPVEAIKTLEPSIEAALAEVGGCLVGAEAYEPLRIEQGQPAWGAEWRSGLLAKEAGLDVAVSYTKGCYPGQEPTYRLHFRGKPSKRLMRLRLAAGSPPPADPWPAPPLPLYAADGKQAGEVTSLARTPTGELVALGYVRRAYLEEAPPLHLGEPQATVQLVAQDQAGPQPLEASA